MNTEKNPSKKALWTGWILSGLVILFLLFDAAGKLMESEVAMKVSTGLGYPPGTVFGIGLTLLICTIIYAVPRTSILGAILLTGYLGGAVATHVRVENPLFSHTLFPVYLGILLWLGLYLRDDGHLRALVPLRENSVAQAQDANTFS